MIIKYNCKCCDLRNLDVPDRVPNSDPAQYIRMIQHCVSYDHRARSPLCGETKINEIHIPADNSAGFGIPKTVN
jgi:hypothetical protein